MKPVERKAIRYTAYGGYTVAAVGAAASVGGAWGWVVGVALSALPGVAMMRYELDERSVKRDRAAGFAKPPPAQDNAEAAPGAMPPPPPPAY